MPIKSNFFDNNINHFQTHSCLLYIYLEVEEAILFLNNSIKQQLIEKAQNNRRRVWYTIEDYTHTDSKNAKIELNQPNSDRL